MAGNRNVNDLYELDLIDNTWTDLTGVVKSMPVESRTNFGFASADNKLFLFGGSILNSKTGECL